jgi:hypothetical protein
MANQKPATKADIKRIEVKLDQILRVVGGVLEALKRRDGEVEAAEWNKAFPPAGRLDEYENGGGI